MEVKNPRCSVTVGCSGSLESNLDLLSSVMESSDDDATDFNANGGQLVRSQSELGNSVIHLFVFIANNFNL